RLLDLYARRARPLLVGPERYWYSTRTMAEQVRRIVDAARKARVRVGVSADFGPDLIVPWRHPTLTIIYAVGALAVERAGLVPAEGRADASVIIRHTMDATLLSPAGCWPAAMDGV